MRLLPLVLAMAVLASCGYDTRPARKTRQQRTAEAEEAVSRTPQPRRYSIDGGQLLVLDIPVIAGRSSIESQRCFVWRDAEFRSSTISCPQPPELTPLRID